MSRCGRAASCRTLPRDRRSTRGRRTRRCRCDRPRRFDPNVRLELEHRAQAAAQILGAAKAEEAVLQSAALELLGRLAADRLDAALPRRRSGRRAPTDWAFAPLPPAGRPATHSDSADRSDQSGHRGFPGRVGHGGEAARRRAGRYSGRDRRGRRRRGRAPSSLPPQSAPFLSSRPWRSSSTARRARFPTTSPIRRCRCSGHCATCSA